MPQPRALHAHIYIYTHTRVRAVRTCANAGGVHELFFTRFIHAAAHERVADDANRWPMSVFDDHTVLAPLYAAQLQST